MGRRPFRQGAGRRNRVHPATGEVIASPSSRERAGRLGLQSIVDQVDSPDVIARLDPKSGLPDFGTLNDRNRKRPISIGNPVSTAGGYWIAPSNPAMTTKRRLTQRRILASPPRPTSTCSHLSAPPPPRARRVTA